MVFISVMTPALQCDSNKQSSIWDLCSQTFGSDIELFQLVPISGNSQIQDQEIVVRLNKSQLSIGQIEKLIQQQESLNLQLERSREALKTYQQELDAYKYLAEQDKNKRIKQLEDENKKLRSLLKQQLENSENLRMETQATVETLREEFNMLVKELANFKGTSFKHEFPLKIEKKEEKNEKYERKDLQLPVQQSAGSKIPKLNM